MNGHWGVVVRDYRGAGVLMHCSIDVQAYRCANLAKQNPMNCMISRNLPVIGLHDDSVRNHIEFALPTPQDIEQATDQTETEGLEFTLEPRARSAAKSQGLQQPSGGQKKGDGGSKPATDRGRSPTRFGSTAPKSGTKGPDSRQPLSRKKRRTSGPKGGKVNQKLAPPRPSTTTVEQSNSSPAARMWRMRHLVRSIGHPGKLPQTAVHVVFHVAAKVRGVH
jgi:hypothetical protein